ncbi:MAG: 50S ribosomal protein L23 [Candidatus Micrarchaeota archaeon]
MILIGPVKTEKAILMIDNDNALTFEVALRSTKKQVQEEVERLFEVKVASVRTFITSKGNKRAVVRLEKGFKADDVATKLKIVA